MQFWANPRKKRTPKRSIWAQKPSKKRPAKRSIWVAKNPQYKKKEKKSIWVSRSPSSAGPAQTYRTTYTVYLLQGNRARRVKTFRDSVEANSWVEDARVRTPYNNYKVQPVSRRKGFF
jgi:hypothetical protein